jgi:hypothetical protein
MAAGSELAQYAVCSHGDGEWEVRYGDFGRIFQLLEWPAVAGAPSARMAAIRSSSRSARVPAGVMGGDSSRAGGTSIQTLSCYRNLILSGRPVKTYHRQ